MRTWRNWSSLVLVAGMIPAAGTAAIAAETSCEVRLLDDQCEGWVAHFEGPGLVDDVVTDAAISPGGERLFVTGFSPGTGTGRDYLTVAFDAGNGQELWSARFDGSRHDSDQPSAVSVSPDGNRVFVTGFSYGAGTYRDAVTVAYEAASGATRWVSRFSGPGGVWDEGQDILVRPAGGQVLVVGSTGGPGSDWNLFSVAYNASNGEEIWRARHATGRTDRLVAAAANGSHLVLAASTDEGSDTGWLLVAQDAENGAFLWESSFGTETPGGDRPTDIALSTDGELAFVAGYATSGDTGRDFTTIAYRTRTGVAEWTARYSGPAIGPDVPAAITVSPDDRRVFVTGSSRGVAWPLLTDPAAATVAYDANTGGELWVSHFPPSTVASEGHALEVAPEGGLVYVAGSSALPTAAWHQTLVAYETLTGSQAWVARYEEENEGGEETLFSMAGDPQGTHVYVAGAAWNPAFDQPHGHQRFAVTAYEA